MPRTARPRAALYVRLSETSDESTSVARQEADLRALAEREGWEVAEVLVDEGISGRRSRERADRAVRMLRDGDVDVLAVWKFDRFSRQGLGALAALIDALDARPSARFVALRDGLSSEAPAWRIIASVLAEVARMEAESISARVRSSVAGLRRSGRFAGGVPPIGYTSAPNPDGPGRVLVPHPEVAPAFREAAQRIIEGASLYTVTHDLNASGVRPPRAEEWSIQAVKQALTGHAIVGRMKVAGDLLRDHDGAPVSVWEPVLDLDLWSAVRATLRARQEARAPVGQRSSSRSRLLSGIAACDACGAPLYVRRGSKSGSESARTVLYRCAGKSNGRKCPGVAVTAERLEALVEERFLAVVGRMPVLVPVEIEPSTAALASIENEIEETTEVMRRPGADLSTLARRLEILHAQRSELSAVSSTPEVEHVESGETIAEVWERADTLTRRDLLTSALGAVMVRKGRRGAHGLDPRRVEVVWRP